MNCTRPQIRPVILAGGSGKRLWPKSRAAFPKQFTNLIGDETLFQSAVKRVTGDGFAAPIIVTAEPFRFIVLEQLDAIGQTAAAVLIEPKAKNTAPAIAVALSWIENHDSDETAVLVAPSDHIIANPEQFRTVVQTATTQTRVITFGITPSRAETGYGWLELADKAQDAPPFPLKRFVEKPASATAKTMFETGGYFWNAGIFLAPSGVFRTAFEKHAPATLSLAGRALETAQSELGFTRLGKDVWSQIDAISVDHAIMEHLAEISVIPWSDGWSDLGSWDALWRESGEGTVCDGSSVAIDCEDSYLSSPDDQRLVGIGLRDIIAVALPDAVLVTTRDAAQEAGRAVDVLAAANAPQATEFPRDNRPWGWFETLAVEGRFRVKRIVVKPGGQLSLQSHQKRAEHWVVVEGTAQVTIGETRRRLSENQSIYVPVGVRHRLENEGSTDLVLIEIQTGSYLGEDDIERFEDAYQRY